jgi:hypothetical protein
MGAQSSSPTAEDDKLFEELLQSLEKSRSSVRNVTFFKLGGPIHKHIILIGEAHVHTKSSAIVDFLKSICRNDKQGAGMDIFIESNTRQMYRNRTDKFEGFEIETPNIDIDIYAIRLQLSMLCSNYRVHAVDIRPDIRSNIDDAEQTVRDIQHTVETLKRSALDNIIPNDRLAFVKSNEIEILNHTASQQINQLQYDLSLIRNRAYRPYFKDTCRRIKKYIREYAFDNSVKTVLQEYLNEIQMKSLMNFAGVDEKTVYYLMIATMDLYCLCRMLLKDYMSNILVFYGGDAHRLDIECMIVNMASLHDKEHPSDPLINFVQKTRIASASTESRKILTEIHDAVSHKLGVQDVFEKLDLLPQVEEEGEEPNDVYSHDESDESEESDESDEPDESM